MNPQTARPATATSRQVRYQRRRALKQTRVTVWIDREDAAFLATVPLNRSDLIRGLVGMARRGLVDLPAATVKRSFGARIKSMMGLAGPATPVFPPLCEPEAPRMGETTPNGQNALHGRPGALSVPEVDLDDLEPMYVPEAKEPE